jgi:PAS domain S-box-containing protein
MRVGSATESGDLCPGDRDSPTRTISIPLRRGGEPFGTFTVHGGDDEFFDDDVVQLLQEMADSISFALDLFDREQARKRTDVALRDSERRLREAQAISNTGDWELNRDTGAMVWSPQLFKLFERRASLGPPDVNEALAYYSADSLELTRERFWHAIDTGERCELEQTLQLRSGALRYHFTVIVPVKDASGRVVRLCGTVQDVTERKLAEQELLRKTAEIEDLYQNAPCGYHSIGADGRFLRINDTELHWLGYTREEVIGRMSFCDVLTAASDAVFRRNFPVFKATGVLRNVEFELRCRDGSTLPVLASSTADFDGDGSFVSSRMILSNISDRKRLEQERIAYLTRLADLSRHLVEVQEMERRKMAGELHDRASPNLAALQITIGNLADHLPAPVLSEVEPLIDDAQALLSATSADIREICNELRPPALDYAGLGAALQTYAEQFSRRAGVAVEVDLSDFNAILPPDIQSLLFRIVQEALTNCSKHARAGTIRIRLADSDDELSLVIADNGIGFDPASLSETTANPGLGLITMKERAELAGGTFTIDAHPGEGTLIRVCFGHSAGWLAPLDEPAAAHPGR